MEGLGAGGLANDTPLGFIYSWGRTLRIIDGLDTCAPSRGRRLRSARRAGGMRLLSRWSCSFG